MARETKEQIIELLEKPLADEGAEVADVVLSRYKDQSTLRVFVYSEHGATLEECARLSRMVGNLVDGTDWFPNGYTLEVSSPGLDRPLKSARDFRYRIGETVKVMFADAKRKKLTAEIVSVTDDRISLKADDGPLDLDLSEIEQAKIVF